MCIESRFPGAAREASTLSTNALASVVMPHVRTVRLVVCLPGLPPDSAPNAIKYSEKLTAIFDNLRCSAEVHLVLSWTDMDPPATKELLANCLNTTTWRTIAQGLLRPSRAQIVQFYTRGQRVSLWNTLWLPMLTGLGWAREGTALALTADIDGQARALLHSPRARRRHSAQLRMSHFQTRLLDLIQCGLAGPSNMPENVVRLEIVGREINFVDACSCIEGCHRTLLILDLADLTSSGIDKRARMIHLPVLENLRLLRMPTPVMEDLLRLFDAPRIQDLQYETPSLDQLRFLGGKVLACWLDKLCELRRMTVHIISRASTWHKRVDVLERLQKQLEAKCIKLELTYRGKLWNQGTIFLPEVLARTVSIMAIWLDIPEIEHRGQFVVEDFCRLSELTITTDDAKRDVDLFKSLFGRIRMMGLRYLCIQIANWDYSEYLETLTAVLPTLPDLVQIDLGRRWSDEDVRELFGGNEDERIQPHDLQLDEEEINAKCRRARLALSDMCEVLGVYLWQTHF